MLDLINREQLLTYGDDNTHDYTHVSIPVGMGGLLLGI